MINTNRQKGTSYAHLSALISSQREAGIDEEDIRDYIGEMAIANVNSGRRDISSETESREILSIAIDFPDGTLHTSPGGAIPYLIEESEIIANCTGQSIPFRKLIVAGLASLFK